MKSMKKHYVVMFLMLMGLIFQSLFPTAYAASPPVLTGPSGLSLIEIKITGNEFVMLQNNTGSAISDLSKYWLYDFNNVNPLAAGVSSSTQQLPPVPLSPGQTVLLNSSGGQTCGAAVTAKLSISLTDAGGFLEVVQTSVVNNVLQQVAGDAVSWSSGANSAPGMIANVPSSTADPAGAYYRYQNTTTPPFLWQLSDVDTTNPCQLDIKIANTLTAGPSNPGNQFFAGSPPPAVFIESSDDSSAGPVIPPSDIGLAAPVVNEILPNPAEPQSDDEDEFIELYNPNIKSFDLTGFKLEVGTRTLHDYTFPSGTQLPPHSFVAFYAVDTNLSMSNTGGQVKLLDPFSNILSQTDIYSSAKDGQTWALANGKWYWTTVSTANGANIIKTPVAAKKKTKTTVKKASAVASAAKIKGAPAAVNSNSNLPSSATQTSNLHLPILVGVGAAALIYALYEYRHDLANRFYQFRRYRENRRIARVQA